MFLAAELFVLPGFGVAGLTGLLMIGASLVLASQDFVIPQTAEDLTTTTVSIGTLLGAGIVFCGLAYVMTSYLGRIPMLSQLILAPSPAGASARDEETSTTGIPSEKKVAIGTIGRTTTILRPSGRALIDGEPMDVVSTGDVIAVNVAVRVVEVGFQRIVVEEAEPTV
jgi:membrane-bound serine protease (ClpP class)